MRSATLILIAVFVAAAGGYAICAVAGWPFEAARVLSAATIAVVGSVAALLPLLLSRGATQPAVAQAGLVGTVIHLFACLAGATVILLVLKQGTTSAYWVLAFYWATLVALVVEFGRAVRKAPAAAPPTSGIPVLPKQ